MEDETTTSSLESRTSSSKGKLGCSLGLIIPLLVLAPLWFFFIGPQMRHDRLAEKGIHVPGRLLDVEETGTVVNDSPELNLVVEFTRKDGVLDTAETDFVPSLRSMHFFQPGAMVTAAYDPEDPEEITIINFQTPSTMPSTAMPGIPPGYDRMIDSLKRMADSLLRMTDSLTRGVKGGK